MSTGFSSCLELIKTDYEAKYGGFQTLRFFIHYFLDNATFAVTNHRIAYYLLLNGFGRTARFVTQITERIAYIHISQGAIIGPGLCIPHGFGIIIAGNVIMGSHCTVQQGVTVGGNFWKERKNADGAIQEYPVMGDYVHLGSGCVVAGPVTIGNSVIISANTTVTTDIPDYSMVIGGRSEIVKKIDPANDDHRKRFRSIIPDTE